MGYTHKPNKQQQIMFINNDKLVQTKIKYWKKAT